MAVNKKRKNKFIKIMNFFKWFGLRKLYFVYLNRKQKKELEKQLNNPQQVNFLIENYDGKQGQNIDQKHNNLGFALIHYSLVRNLKPKNILVIGSLKGFIPAILAKACKDNHQGHVDFVDAAYEEDDQGKNWQGIGFWKKINPKEHFSKIFVDKYISTHVMTNKEFAKKYNKKRYQYIYIDGDHSYEGVKLDYKLFYPKLDKDGLMLFHDVVAKGKLTGGQYGAYKFWKELKNKEKLTFPYPQHSGLGIIRKTNQSK